MKPARRIFSDAEILEMYAESAAGKSDAAIASARGVSATRVNLLLARVLPGGRFSPSPVCGQGRGFEFCGIPESAGRALADERKNVRERAMLGK